MRRPVGLVNQVGAAQQVDGEEHGLRKAGQTKTDSGAQFYEIGPCLALRVHGDIRVPLELHAQQRGAGGVTGASLLVDQKIVSETARKTASPVVAMNKPEFSLPSVVPRLRATETPPR